MNKSGWMASAALPIALWALPAFAQSTPAPAAPAASDQASEIVVTAQKRVQRINDVGMSINALSGDDLVMRGVQDPTTLAKAVPGFEYNTNAFGNPIYTLRGVGFRIPRFLPARR